MKLACVFFVFVVRCLSEHRVYSTIEAKRDEERALEQKAYPILSSIVKEGTQRAIQECQKLFKSEIWNCILDNRQVNKELPLFVKTVLPRATRETAFIHAISTAAIIHEILLQCRLSKIPGCGCADKGKQRQGNGDWQWGGCSDNIRFAEMETSRFITKLENGHDARTAFNLHNNEVGRKVVRLSFKRECKCHGVTGGCHLKTCWRQLQPLALLGSKLKLKYRSALQVVFVDSKLREATSSELRSDKMDKKLVFLEDSPDFCEQNDILGYPGMLGRTCSSDDVTTKRCRSMCNICKMKPKTVEKRKEIDCRCQFVWCCSVQCETCTRRYSETTCIRNTKKGRQTSRGLGR